MSKRLYEQLSAVVEARLNCAKVKADGTATNPEWYGRWYAIIQQLVKDFLPSGSGFDSGTKIDLDASHAEKLVFHTSYHHMDDVGYYDGWTEHTVTVTPSFRGIKLRVSGRDRNEIKDYIYEAFEIALCTEIDWDKEKECWYSPEMRRSAEEWQRKVKTGEIV